MNARWSTHDVSIIDAARELEIAARRADGGLRPWVPIWVVCTGGRAYVRTWHRRDTGWFGQALRSGRARIRVPGLEADVTVENVGDTSDGITRDVDAAYRDKYGDSGASSMVSATAAATTLRLDPA